MLWVVLRYFVPLEDWRHVIVNSLSDLLAEDSHTPTVLGQEGREMGGDTVHLPGDSKFFPQAAPDKCDFKQTLAK